MKKIALLTVLVVSTAGCLQAADKAASWQIPGVDFVRNHSTAFSTVSAAVVLTAVLETYQLPGQFRKANDISHSLCSTVSYHFKNIYTKIKDFCASLMSTQEAKTK